MIHLHYYIYLDCLDHHSLTLFWRWCFAKTQFWSIWAHCLFWHRSTIARSPGTSRKALAFHCASPQATWYCFENLYLRRWPMSTSRSLANPLRLMHLLGADIHRLERFTTTLSTKRSVFLWTSQILDQCSINVVEALGIFGLALSVVPQTGLPAPYISLAPPLLASCLTWLA